jgi:hypothetical protein
MTEGPEERSQMKENARSTVRPFMVTSLRGFRPSWLCDCLNLFFGCFHESLHEALEAETLDVLGVDHPIPRHPRHSIQSKVFSPRRPLSTTLPLQRKTPKTNNTFAVSQLYPEGPGPSRPDTFACWWT